jgi:hypothetical protein
MDISPSHRAAAAEQNRTDDNDDDGTPWGEFEAAE